MEIEFKLEETDLVTLAKYQMEHSPAIVRRYRLQRYGLLVLFGLLSLVSYFILRKPTVATYSAILAAFCFGLYPFYYRWVTARTLRQIVGALTQPGGVRAAHAAAEHGGNGPDIRRQAHHDALVSHRQCGDHGRPRFHRG